MDEVPIRQRDLKAQLKGWRWLLLKTAKDLTQEQQAKLEAMCAVSPTRKRLPELKEAFRTILKPKVSQ
jgi:hypothetical protein